MNVKLWLPSSSTLSSSVEGPSDRFERVLFIDGLRDAPSPPFEAVDPRLSRVNWL